MKAKVAPVLGLVAAILAVGCGGAASPRAASGPPAPAPDVFVAHDVRIPGEEGRHSASHTHTVQDVRIEIRGDAARARIVTASSRSYVICPSHHDWSRTMQACVDQPRDPERHESTHELAGRITRTASGMTITFDATGPHPPATLACTTSTATQLDCRVDGAWPSASWTWHRE